MDKSKYFVSSSYNESFETMIRAAQSHHQQLSSLADQKASFIMAATSIIFTLSLNLIKMDTIIWALVSLAVFSLVALIFAILTVAPIFKPNKKIDSESEQFNPLFFGHFTNLSYKQYLKHMAEIYVDNAKICETLVRDLYQIGKVLNQLKYRYLRISYRAFFLGLVISVVLFILQLSLGYEVFSK